MSITESSHLFTKNIIKSTTQRDIQENKSVLKFIKKLVEVISSTESLNIIEWSDDGKVIEIRNENEFKDRILPLFFKHNNFSNFIRQLNMYSFKKIRKYKDDIIAYSHQYFLKNDISKLHLINRNSQVLDAKESSSNLKLTQGSISDEFKKASFKLFNIEQEYNRLLEENKIIIEKHNNLQLEQNQNIKYIKNLEAFVYFLINKDRFLGKKYISDDCMELLTSNYKKLVKSPDRAFKIQEENQVNSSFLINNLELKEESNFLNYNIKPFLNGGLPSFKDITFKLNSFISTENTDKRMHRASLNVLKLNSNMSGDNPFASYKLFCDKISSDAANVSTYAPINKTNDDSYFMNSSSSSEISS